MRTSVIVKIAGAGTVCLAVVLAVLGGCASKAPKNVDLSKSPNEGIAIFSVSHESEAGRGVTLMVYLDRDSNALGLSPPYRSVEEVAGIRTGSDFEDDYGRLEVVNLPAGRHSFSDWQISNGTGLRIFPGKGLQPLVFDIRPGSVVYLGDFHGITAVGRNLFGMKITGDGYPELRDSHQRDIPIFESKYPQFRGKAELQLLPVGPWVGEEAKKRLDPTTPPTR
jgi:hypothetical protein